MSNTIIFTEIVNCGPVGKIMLESFHKYHAREITIYATQKDIDELGAIKSHPNNSYCIISAEQAEKFKRGHEGTADIFAEMFYPKLSLEETFIIHCDSDLIFKKESISLLENEMIYGYEIVGSRRCYKNNPGKVPLPDGIPDAVSTYFFGMRASEIPKGYTKQQLAHLIAGHPGPLNHPILDFFDPITFLAMSDGAVIKFIDSNLIGGQNSEGSKVNDYKSNLHLDMGSHLCHLGGCGSGYAVAHGISKPEKSYAEWSMGRWGLFSKLFYDRDIAFSQPTVYDNDGRWVSGGYDDHVLNLIKGDLQA
jgi:hypothetical protein